MITPNPQESAFCAIPRTGTWLLNPTPQAQEGGDGGRGGNRRVQVTIYGPLVTVVLSLRPAPSKNWGPLLKPQAGCPPRTRPFGDRWPSQGAERQLWKARPTCGRIFLSPVSQPAPLRPQTPQLKPPLLEDRGGEEATVTPFHEHPSQARPSPTHTLGLPCKAPSTGNCTTPVLLFNVGTPHQTRPQEGTP